MGGFHDLSWNLYRVPVDSAARQDRFAAAARRRRPAVGLGGARATPPPASPPARAVPPPPDARLRRRRRGRRFPGYGGAQGIFFVASDLLGDNLLFGSRLAPIQGRRLGSILANLSGTAVYLNQSRRVNWGLGAFRTKSRNFEGDQVVAYDETAYGAIGLLRYPLTRFTPDRGHHGARALRPGRLHPAGGRAAPDRLDRVPLPELRARQLALDPERADRRRPSRLTAGVSSDFSNSRFDSYLVSRRLAALLPAWASGAPGRSAAFGFYSGGDRPRRVNIGGTLGLRGYPQFGYIVGSEAFMFNQEIRFPLLTHLTLGTPLGDLDFPEIQAGLFTDLGRPSSPPRPTARSSAATELASAWRWARSRSSGWTSAAGSATTIPGLQPERRTRRKPGFVSFFFGYNY